MLINDLSLGVFAVTLARVGGGHSAKETFLFLKMCVCFMLLRIQGACLCMPLLDRINHQVSVIDPY